MDQIKIFYSHSNNQNVVLSLYEKICDKIDTNSVEIIDIENEIFTPTLLNMVKNSIDSCDLFICDITPDAPVEENKPPLINSNVMMELGYAWGIGCNVMYILNTEITKMRPSFLEGEFYVEYQNNCDDHVDIIIDKIKEKTDALKNYKNGQEWKTIKYTISDILLNCISSLLDVRCEHYVVRVNSSQKRAIILFVPNGGAYSRTVDIIKKTLYLHKLKTTINLSTMKDINDELKHLEIMANLVWFN